MDIKLGSSLQRSKPLVTDEHASLKPMAKGRAVLAHPRATPPESVPHTLLVGATSNICSYDLTTPVVSRLATRELLLKVPFDQLEERVVRYVMRLSKPIGHSVGKRWDLVILRYNKRFQD